MGKLRRNIFFASDQHFDHLNIIKFCDRPFKNVDEMNKKLIENWNKQVRERDHVYILGDFVWNTTSKKDYRELIKELNGNIHLVIGNHDQITTHQAIGLGFASACYEMKLKIAGEYVKLSHYPYRYKFWKQVKIRINNFLKGRKTVIKHALKRPKDEGGWLICGHTHSKIKIQDKMINVCIDAWDYKLVPMEKIANMIREHKKDK